MIENKFKDFSVDELKLIKKGLLSIEPLIESNKIILPLLMTGLLAEENTEIDKSKDFLSNLHKENKKFVSNEIESILDNKEKFSIKLLVNKVEEVILLKEQIAMEEVKKEVKENIREDK